MKMKQGMAVLWWWFMVLGGVAFAQVPSSQPPVPSHGEKVQTPIQHTEQDQNTAPILGRGSEHSPLFVKMINAPNPKANAHKHREKADAKAPEHWWAMPDWWVAILTGLLAIVAVGQLVVFFVQLRTMVSALEDSKQATEAATKASETAEAALKASAESSHLDQRAWLGISTINLQPMRAGEQLVVIVKTINTGKTFGLRYRHASMMILTDTEIVDAETAKKSPDYRIAPSVGVVFPNANNFIPITSDGHGLSQDLIDQVNAGRWLVYVIGEIFYDDIFGGHHTTRFFQRYVPTASAFQVEPTHNDAD